MTRRNSIQSTFYWLMMLLCICTVQVAFAQRQSYVKFNRQILDHPAENGAAFESMFRTQEISRFDKDTVTQAIVLENGYAQSAIKNAADWQPIKDRRKYAPVCVILVYSKYPKDKSFWLTDYHQLLANRLKALFQADPSLNDNRIAWKILLQTDCNSEKEAESLFHGIIIYYRPLTKNVLTRLPPAQNKPSPAGVKKKDSMSLLQAEQKIRAFIGIHGNDTDSTVVKVFQRHPDWKRSLVVMDWTGSMYPYGSQLALWHYLNTRNEAVKYYVFFNDGNNMPDSRKKPGHAGGVYFSEAKSYEQVVNLFNKVIKQGNGGDEPENDVEAILRGIHKYKDAEEVILIADNWSDMRDYSLIDSIKMPVKVILCGARGYVNVQYVNLAYKTGGSLHTIEMDMESMRTNTPDAGIQIDNIPFVLNKDGTEYVYKSEKDDIRRVGKAPSNNSSKPAAHKKHHRFLWIF